MSDGLRTGRTGTRTERTNSHASHLLTVSALLCFHLCIQKLILDLAHSHSVKPPSYTATHHLAEEYRRQAFHLTALSCCTADDNCIISNTALTANMVDGDWPNQ